MSTLGQLLRSPSPRTVSLRLGEVQVSSIAQDTQPETAAAGITGSNISVREEQIYSLVYQLFLGQASLRVRNVCFASIEVSETAAHLCLEVAQALAAQGKYDVGLVDAGSGIAPLHHRLQIPGPSDTNASWQIAPALWMVPQDAWSKKLDHDSTRGRNMERLRDSMAEFDFSVLCCGPVSWLTRSIAQSCDGLVLVLTANKTRRLVAVQVKEQLAKAHIPLLGTVLAERRLPVPSSLYRVL